MDGHHHQFREFMEKRLGPYRYNKLVKRNADSILGKKYKQTKGVGAIAKYYREVYQDMVIWRMSNSDTIINFEEYKL
jgi:hypothetical protein